MWYKCIKINSFIQLWFETFFLIWQLKLASFRILQLKWAS